jgi:predicted O-methyltransferase YrrM
MAMSERVVLYSLLVGLRPRRCLEIGTHRGGSALIIAAALDDIEQGSLACVDLAPAIAPQDWRAVAHRTTLYPGASLGVLTEMARGTGARFDFAPIDGDHSTSGALGDIQAVLPVLQDTARIVLHDAHNDKVAEAILLAVGKPGNGLTDCGMISAEKFPPSEGEYWGGLRLLRFFRRKSASGGLIGAGS